MNREDPGDLLSLCEGEIFGVCVCVFWHLVVCEQASVEEDLLSVALTPLQMSHSFLPFKLWGGESEVS